MAYAQDAESLWTEKVTTAQSAQQKSENIAGKTENFTEKTTFVQSVEKIVFLMEKGYARNAEQNEKTGENH